jgi:hypothetical protein
LFASVEAAEVAAREVGRSAAATAAGLARRIDSIRGIKLGINQMALNAHLKCCRLGDPGRPLSVIAVELRVSADELGDTAGGAEEILGRMASAPSAETAPAANSAAAVGALLEAAAAPVREAERKAGADLAALAAQGETMVSALQQTTGRLNFHSEVSEVLVRVAGTLRDGLAGAAVSADVAPAGLAALMVEIGALYTMARERDVHRAFVPAPDETAAAA